MKIELKKIKYAAFLSQETSAFTAEIWIDGKKAGTASNEGHGGATDVWVSDPALATQASLYAKSLPPLPSTSTLADGTPLFPNGLSMDLELLIDGLLEDHLQAKDAAKQEKKLAKLAAKAKAQGHVLLVVTYPGSYVHVSCNPANVEPWKQKILKRDGANGVARVLQ